MNVKEEIARKTKVNNSAVEQLPVFGIFMVSLVLFAGILFFGTSKTGFKTTTVLSANNVELPKNQSSAIMFGDSEKNSRNDAGTFAQITKIEASVHQFQCPELEENKLNVKLAEKNRRINQLILASAYHPTLQAEPNGYGFTIKWAKENAPCCFFLRQNAYLIEVAKKKNQEICAQIEQYWQIKNYQETETEMPLSLEEWMIDENCWCPVLPDRMFEFLAMQTSN